MSDFLSSLYGTSNDDPYAQLFPNVNAALPDVSPNSSILPGEWNWMNNVNLTSTNSNPYGSLAKILQKPKMPYQQMPMAQAPHAGSVDGQEILGKIISRTQDPVSNFTERGIY